MSWTCQMCGYENDDEKNACVCGFLKEGDAESIQDESADIFGEIEKKANSFALEQETVPEESKKIKMKVKEKPETKAAKVSGDISKKDDEVLIKEIEGWQFTFSDSEKCMYLGTPALQSFRLKLELTDLEDLIDSFYEKTGVEKVKPVLDLNKADMLELISVLDNMIESKMSKVKVQFNDNDIKVISDIISGKLQA